MQRWLGLGFLGLLAACGNPLQINDSCNNGYYSADNCASSLHWPDGSKVNFEFSSAVPKYVRPAIAHAALDYNNILARTSIALNAESNAAPVWLGQVTTVSGDGVNGIYWISEPWPWPNEPDTDAMTVVIFSPDRITEADIFLRADSFNKRNLSTMETIHSIDTSIEDGDINVKWSYLLALHEFGHALGRVHNTTKDSIMQPAVRIEQISIGLSKSDVDVLGTVYALRPNSMLLD